MSFLIDDLRTLWRMRGLLAVLTRREISGRFAGSAGGMLWAWVQPVLNIAAYFLVFDVVFAMRMGDNAPADRVGTFLIVGMLAWMAFAEAVQRGMGSLVEAGGILQKNPLPSVLFPARSVLASAATADSNSCLLTTPPGSAEGCSRLMVGCRPGAASTAGCGVPSVYTSSPAERDSLRMSTPASTAGVNMVCTCSAGQSNFAEIASRSRSSLGLVVKNWMTFQASEPASGV